MVVLASLIKTSQFNLQCEPIHGYGFRRGGYQCRCKPGHRLPNTVRRPYLGEIVERATSEQHHDNFHCEKIGCKLVAKSLLFTMSSRTRVLKQGFRNNQFNGGK